MAKNAQIGQKEDEVKKKFPIFCLMFLIITGCAATDKYLPKHALTKPIDGVSISHPVELEKAGIKTITTLQGLMDPGLWVEVVGAGGVWPWLAQDSSGKILNGYAHLVGATYWGDWEIQFVFLGAVKELQFAKILYFNRDAGFAYNLAGEQIEYDPKKFETDNGYQDKVFSEKGTTPKELDEFWKGYLVQKGLNPPNNFTSIVEIKVGNSPEWDNFKGKITKVFPYNYKMGNGEIRSGYLPLEIFRQTAVEITDFNGVDRYLKRAKVPIIALPFAGAGILVIAGAGVVGDAVAAGVDDSWTGAYARAETLRYKMAPLFGQICLIYKELLKNRDERIEKLETQLKVQDWTFQNPQFGEGRKE